MIQSFRTTLVAAAALLVGACASTGQSPLPAGAAAYTAVPETAEQDHAADLIRVGDKLDLRVFGEPELSGDAYVVDSSGVITIPLVGEVIAVMQTPRQLAAEIERRLAARYVRSPSVIVSVVERPLASFTVEGSVGSPGIYTAQPNTTLLSAIAQAKSPTKLAKVGDIIVLRKIGGQRAGARFNLNDIRLGRAADPQILAGDTIVVTDSAAKSAWNDLLQTLPLLNLFVFLNKN